VNLRENNLLNLARGAQLHIYARSGEWHFVVNPPNFTGQVVTDETDIEVDDESK
jgi:diphthamide synthase (EF-2-diphthine--ammonia ligase)